MPLPTHGSKVTPMVYLETFVVGDARTRCVFLENAAGDRRAVLWPEGYRAAFGPLRIYDPRGEIVWREGVEHAVGGGASPVHVERIPRACRVGRDTAWWLPGPGEPPP